MLKSTDSMRDNMHDGFKKEAKLLYKNRKCQRTLTVVRKGVDCLMSRKTCFSTTF